MHYLWLLDKCKCGAFACITATPPLFPCNQKLIHLVPCILRRIPRNLSGYYTLNFTPSFTSTHRFLVLIFCHGLLPSRETKFCKCDCFGLTLLRILIDWRVLYLTFDVLGKWPNGKWIWTAVKGRLGTTTCVQFKKKIVTFQDICWWFS